MISSQSPIITAKGNLLCSIINHPLSLVIELVVQWQLFITGQTEKTYTLLKIIILIDQYTMYWPIVCSSTLDNVPKNNISPANTICLRNVLFSSPIIRCLTT